MNDMPINQSTSQPINYILHLADDALIMSQRLSEWTGHGPVLEQDIALTNIALDYLGQARNFYQYAAQKQNEAESATGPQALLPGGEERSGEVTEDSLAMLRLEHEFKNHLLVELPNGDWGQTVLKVFFFSAYQKLLMQQLVHCTDEQVKGIAEKSLKEVSYHLRWSREWVLRLGDGTAESHERMRLALEAVWMYTGELCVQPDYHQGWVDYTAMKTDWMEHVQHTLAEATLDAPVAAGFQSGGLYGRHTEHLGYLLAEMQYLQRVYPNSEW
ncbi:MAG: phenylacetate-CoA oxygenase subunit PaaC [Chitinophagaceae bacterium]|jgi:ring-1,2-phenylacetyl-CoA epoxidase subunit PaaC|nr:phenylacetate-CoA oxygenase subunit PaaC [Chitinophagaceae bacterium]